MQQLIIPILIFVFLWSLIYSNKKVKNMLSSRNMKRFFLILLILSLANIGRILSYAYEKQSVIIPVKENNFASQFFYRDSIRPLIKYYSQTEIRGFPTLTKRDAGPGFTVVNLIVQYDLLNALMYFLIMIVLSVNTWNLNLEKPFTGNLGKTLYKISTILFIFWLLEFAKNYSVDLFVKNKTDGDYRYEDFFNSFNSASLWLGAIFFQFSQIVKSGEKIQKEQELTI
jgi:hypothetical protein